MHSLLTRLRSAPLIPPEPYTLSKEAEALVNEINTQWDSLRSRRAKNAASRERLAAVDPLQFTLADAKAKQRTSEEELAILQAEIPVVRKLAEWALIRPKERNRAADSALAAEEAAIAKSQEQLNRAGFTMPTEKEVNADPDEAGYWRTVENALGAVAATHPNVRPLTKKRQELRSLSHESEDLKPHHVSEAAAEAEAELKRLIASL